MRIPILRVEQIRPQHLGSVFTLTGMLLCHDLTCWLVPADAKREMDSIRRGVRIRLPGLGQEAFESPLARVTNGRPGTSVEETEITGRLVAPDSDEWLAQLVEVTSVVFRAGGQEQTVDLTRITEASAWKLERVAEITDPVYRERLMKKYVEQRSK